MSQDPTAGAPEPEGTQPADPTPAEQTAATPEPAAEPVTETVSEPVVETVSEPVVEPVVEPDAQPTPEPAPGPEADETEYDAYVVPAGTVIVDGPGLPARLGAEVLGTFFLVFAGLAVALFSSSNFAILGGGSGALGVALAFGLALAAGAAAFGHVSGGHFNPAVTLGAALGGRTSWKDVLPYWLAQLVGGALGAAVAFIAIPSDLPNLVQSESARAFFSAVANGYGEHTALSTATGGQAQTSLFTAIVIELVVTGIFVAVILGSTDRRANTRVAPFAIGLTLAVGLLITIPLTNGALNPARATAAAIFSETWAWKQLWVFWAAPLVGAALAGIVYRAFAAEPPLEDNLLEEDDVYVTGEDVVVVEEQQR